MLQPQQLNEQLREVNSAREAAEQARDEATAELNMLKATAADQQEQFSSEATLAIERFNVSQCLFKSTPPHACI